jgi:hypothetical protein
LVTIKERLELNGAHQCLVYADGVNLLGEDINIIKKYTVLLHAGKEVGLEVNAEKNCNYMSISRHQTTEPNHNAGSYM